MTQKKCLVMAIVFAALSLFFGIYAAFVPVLGVRIFFAVTAILDGVVSGMNLEDFNSRRWEDE